MAAGVGAGGLDGMHRHLKMMNSGAGWRVARTGDASPPDGCKLAKQPVAEAMLLGQEVARACVGGHVCACVRACVCMCVCMLV